MYYTANQEYTAFDTDEEGLAFAAGYILAQSIANNEPYTGISTRRSRNFVGIDSIATGAEVFDLVEIGEEYRLYAIP